MPNRILRDWTDSFTMDKLDVNEERFFTRLIMKVDDYGCFYADARLIKANLFPLKTDIRETDISRWIAACETAGLIALYNVADKEYLQITNFKQVLRQRKRKFPPPDGYNTDDAQLHSNSNAIASLNQNQNQNQNQKAESESEGEKISAPDFSNSNLFRKPKIPDREEVQMCFVHNGGTVEMADAFFERNQATEWYFKGSPITNYTSMVSSFIKNWKQNEKKNGNLDTGIKMKQI